MAGLDPAIHVVPHINCLGRGTAWMPGTSPGMMANLWYRVPSPYSTPFSAWWASLIALTSAAWLASQESKAAIRSGRWALDSR